MARLSATERANLPDSAFAYVDSKGRRRLPIHDEPHVRAALARFNQVVFENEDALDRARARVLRAAQKFGIVPVGFITGQLRSERQAARAGAGLPTGDLTLLMTDIEGSTRLLGSLGDRYVRVLEQVRRLIRTAVVEHDGKEVDARADEVFAVFADPRGAVRAAVDIQRSLRVRRWPQGQSVRVRAGIHSGRPDLTTNGYVGLSVNTVARVCFAAHGGQILMTGTTHGAVGDLEGVALRDLGEHPLAGIPRRQRLFQVSVDGLPDDFPPLRTTKA